MDLATCEKKLAKVPNLVLSQTRTVFLEGSLLGTYLPVVFLVIALSTPRLRASWAFRTQFIAVLLAIANNGLTYHAFTYAKESLSLAPDVHRDYTQTQLFVASVVIDNALPWVVDIALLFKLVSLFPSWSATPRKRATMLAFPFLTLIPRFAIFIAIGTRSMQGWNDPGSGPFRLEILIYIIVSLGLQVAQNIYCSAILILKAHRYFAADSSRSPSVLHARLRLRFFLESLLFSFIPGTLSSAALFLLYVIQVAAGLDNASTAAASRYLTAFQGLLAIHSGFLTIFWQGMRGRSAGVANSSRGSQDEILDRSDERHSNPGHIDPKDRTLVSFLAVDEIPAEEMSEAVEQIGTEFVEDPHFSEKLRDRWRH